MPPLDNTFLRYLGQPLKNCLSPFTIGAIPCSLSGHFPTAFGSKIVKAFFAQRLNGLVAALLAIQISANADTLFTSAFHGNTSATVLAGNTDNTSGNASLTITDWTTNAAVTSISGLTAISTSAGGFAVLQNGAATYANTNCAYISCNLNLNVPCKRGYSLHFHHQ